jgi:hypothetical protein
MDAQDRNRGERFTAVELETDMHAATVEAAVGMVQLAFLGPVTNTTTTLTRHEARTVALAMIAASEIEEEEER